LISVPIDDALLIFAMERLACRHDLAEMLLAGPKVCVKLARGPTKRPRVVFDTEQRDVGGVVEHQKVRPPADLDREFRVQAEIHQKP
jgi:hypothetical protein